MKSINIKELTDEELSELINEESLNYTKMRLSHAITPLESPANLGATRKKIARLMTEERARQLAK
ncbi:MAG: 50S ribosomal protein L29 [Bacteroidetes bacterium]|jgi:large subunit ribosomal protein L29|nr:50S ribosomal protein L29 [Bacteroidota bacterium]